MLFIHKVSSPRPVQLTCTICGKKFNTSRALRFHKVQHSGKFKCLDSNCRNRIAYPSRTLLEKHLNYHSALTLNEPEPLPSVSSSSDDESKSAKSPYVTGLNPGGYYETMSSSKPKIRIDTVLNNSQNDETLLEFKRRQHGRPGAGESSGTQPTGSEQGLSGSYKADSMDTCSTSASRNLDSTESESSDPGEPRTTNNSYDSDEEAVFHGMGYYERDPSDSHPCSDIEHDNDELHTDGTCPQGICDNDHRVPEPTGGQRSVPDCSKFKGLEVVEGRRNRNAAQTKKNWEELQVNNPPNQPCEHIEAKYYGPEMCHGVRAKRHICKNSLITRYHGVYYRKKADVLKLERSMEEEDAPPGDYIFHSKNVYVDATADDGSLGRLINHSRLNPNAEARSYTILTGPHAKDPAIVIRAIKCIPAGAQLFFDYGERRSQILDLKTWLKH